MVWAIDLDDNYLAALRSISDAQYLNSSLGSFDLVDLKYIFPEDLLPPAGTVPSYGLTTFGSAADAGDMSPGAGFGFLLFAGDSHVVTQLRKRDGQPDPFVFLDCPSNMNMKDKDTTFTARVICLSDDLQGCFQVAERGVEGTIVEMPDNVSSYITIMEQLLTDGISVLQTLSPEPFPWSNQKVSLNRRVSRSRFR
jgi:chitinase